jgi:hypothetical protein
MLDNPLPFKIALLYQVQLSQPNQISESQEPNTATKVYQKNRNNITSVFSLIISS